MPQLSYDEVNLMLRLYDMRREPRLRQARAWFVEHFHPVTPEEIRKVVSSRPVQTASGALQITMSIGVLLSNAWGVRPVEEILHEVDAALYAAKAAGRNCIRIARPDVPSPEVVNAVRETVEPLR